MHTVSDQRDQYRFVGQEDVPAASAGVRVRLNDAAKPTNAAADGSPALGLAHGRRECGRGIAPTAP